MESLGLGEKAFGGRACYELSRRLTFEFCLYHSRKRADDLSRHIAYHLLQEPLRIRMAITRRIRRRGHLM